MLGPELAQRHSHYIPLGSTGHSQSRFHEGSDCTNTRELGGVPHYEPPLQNSPNTSFALSLCIFTFVGKSHRKATGHADTKY